MLYPAETHVLGALERRIQRRTGWRVRELAIEFQAGRTVLRGRATSLVARQLAQHIVGDFFPHHLVENSIVVDNSVEILPGLPMN